MENQTIVTQICKVILYAISIIVWAFVFLVLVLFAAPIWAFLQLIITIIVVKICLGNSKRQKEIFKNLEELNRRIERLESKVIIDDVIAKAENREER